MPAKNSIKKKGKNLLKKNKGRKSSNFLIAIIVLLIAVGIGFVYWSITNSPAKNPSAAARDAKIWPFASNSIWNLPIGSGAVYKKVGFTTPNYIGFDEDVIVTQAGDTASKLRRVKSGCGWDCWGPQLSCMTETNDTGIDVPIHDDFTITRTHPYAGGDFPNLAVSMQLGDGKTLVEAQIFTRCNASSSTVAIGNLRGRLDLTGSGLPTLGPSGGVGQDSGFGGHGGSGLTAMGGTIRKGELLNSEPIHHALKMLIDMQKWASKNSGPDGGPSFRWPAVVADGCAPGCYGQYPPNGNTGMLMGSLLALPPSMNCDTLGLTTTPAKKICHALQDYGAYVADKSDDPGNYDVPRFSLEPGVFEEANATGVNVDADPSQAYFKDMNKVYTQLSMVDNWTKSLYQTVAASNGSMGSGGGAPRVVWAPPIGGTISSPTPIVAGSPTPSPVATVQPQTGVFRGDYFNNTTLSGTPVLTRTEGTTNGVNFNWTGSPGTNVTADNFSVRWTGQFKFDGAQMRFNSTVDDGVRVKVDGTVVIDAWRNQAATTYNALFKPTAGVHTVIIEFYDACCAAVAQVNWVHASSCFDMTGDGLVNDADLNVASKHFGATGDTPWNVNGGIINKVVNSSDLLLIAKQKGTSCS